MKKLFLIAFALVFAFSAVKADERDRIITKEQLPAAAQQLIAKYFAGLKISLVNEDREFASRNYEVVFADGTKLEFSSKGNWEEVDCRYGEVPSAVVPAPILNYIKENYPGDKVLKIERDRSRYEVKLSNRFELTFDSDFNIIDIDN